MTTGLVDIGAFRTYPTDYRADGPTSEKALLPAHKLAEYGAHADRYYPLDVEVFTAPAIQPLFHLLWNEYWAHTLCTGPSPLQRALTARSTADLVERLKTATKELAHAHLAPGGAGFTQAARSATRTAGKAQVQQIAHELTRRAADKPLAKIAADAYVPMLTQRQTPCAHAAYAVPRDT